jgi:hypothetical protein
VEINSLSETMNFKNHYNWLDANFPVFCQKLGIEKHRYNGLIVCHGDKCYSYRSRWEEAGIPFEHGVAIYLISYLHPWSDEVRQVGKKWVDVCKWVIENYYQFKEHLTLIQGVSCD